jgi:uncharacterized protein (DUF427 family)
MKSVFNNTTIAESDDTVVVEGNHYFPPQDVATEYLKESAFTTTCPWKGKASYYHVQVNDQVSENAAWYYPAPKEKAAHIKDYVAFWKDVRVVE